MVRRNLGKALVLIICFLWMILSRAGPAQVTQSTSPQGSLIAMMKDVDRETKPHLLLEISEKYLSNSIARSKEYALIALQAGRKVSNNEFMADAYKHTGNVYYYLDSNEIAITYYDSSLALYNESGDSTGIARIYNNKAIIYSRMGMYNEALDLHLRSMEIKEKTDNPVAIAHTMNNIGSIYYSLEQYERSLDYFNRALEIVNRHNEEAMQQVLLNNIGLIMLENGEVEKAMGYFRKSLSKSLLTGNADEMANAYLNSGRAYIDLGQYDSALFYYHRASELNKKLGVRSSLLQNNLAQVYIEKGMYNRAKSYLDSALAIARLSKNNQDLRSIHKNYSVLYERMGDFEMAYWHFMEFEKLDDLISDQIQSRKLLEVETAYATRTKEKEIEKMNAEIQRQRYVINSFIIGVIVIIVFSYILFRLYRQKKAANEKLREQNKEITRSRNMISDINRELSENEEKFRMIVENMPVLITAFGNDGNIAFWNAECEKVTGYSAKDMIGNPNAVKWLSPGRDKNWLPVMDEEIAETGGKEYTGRLTGKDGQERIVAWTNVRSGIPVKEWKHWLVGIDVTERIRAQETISKSEEKLRKIFDSSPYSISLADFKGNILDINPAGLKMLGFESKKEVVGMHIDRFLSPRNDKNGLANFRKAFLRTGTSHNEYILLRNDGTEFYAEISATVLKDPHDKPIAMLTNIIDITERVRFIGKLKEAKQKAEEADRLKSAFLANMSHEIRTPMNSIVGFVNLLAEDKAAPEKKNEYYRYIVNSSEALMKIIDDIIDISKIEVGQLAVKKTNFYVGSMLSELYANFVETRAINKVDIRLVKPADCDELMLFSDPYRIRQILNNLLSNAIKFTEEGYIEIGCEVSGNEKDREFQFFVKDTGIGIPDDKLNVIFKRFTQIEQVHTKKFRGTGLGLSISKSLAGLLGGKLLYENNPDGGSIFRLLLPERPERQESAAAIGYGDKDLKWRDKSVLVVEDEDSNYELIRAALLRTGVHIVRAGSGLEAVEMAGNECPDLILMDLRLPELDGYEATRRIKAANPGIPIVAITAQAMKEDRVKCMEAGFDDYFAKPVGPSGIREIASSYLD